MSRPVTAEEARRWLLELQRRLGEMVRRDSGTEIDMSTLRVIEALIASAEEHLSPANAVVDRIDKFFSPESIYGGLPVLASQVEVIVRMVAAALPVPRPQEDEYDARPT